MKNYSKKSCAIVLALAWLSIGCSAADTAAEADAHIARLKSGNALERLEAARALQTMGPAAKAAVPILEEILRQRPKEVGGDKVREQTIATLGAIGPEARAALPTLLKLAVDPYEKQRDACSTALEKLGVKKDAAMATLASFVDDPDDKMRSKAAAGLAQLPLSSTEDVAYAVPALVKALANTELSTHGLVRSKILNMLSIRRQSQKTALGRLLVPRWFGEENAKAAAEALLPELKELKEKKVFACYEAAEIMRELGAPGRIAIPELMDGLGSTDKLLNYYSASALSFLLDPNNPADAANLRRLLDVLPEQAKTYGMGEELARLLPEVKEMLPLLCKVVANDTQRWQQSAAIRAIRQRGAELAETAPALVEVLINKGEEQWQAFEALNEMGAAIAPSAPAILKALPRMNADIADRVVRMLQGIKLSDEAICMGIAANLDDADPALRMGTIVLLEKLGPKARAAIAGLAGRLGDPVLTLRALAFEALEKIDGAALDEATQLASADVRERLTDTFDLKEVGDAWLLKPEDAWEQLRFSRGKALHRAVWSLVAAGDDTVRKLGARLDVDLKKAPTIRVPATHEALRTQRFELALQRVLVPKVQAK